TARLPASPLFVEREVIFTYSSLARRFTDLVCSRCSAIQAMPPMRFWLRPMRSSLHAPRNLWCWRLAMQFPRCTFDVSPAAAGGLMSYAAAFIIILQNLIFGTHSHPAVTMLASCSHDARSRRYRGINGSRRHVSDNGSLLDRASLGPLTKS